MTLAEVLVIGDALIDVTVRPAAALSRGGDVPASIALAPGGQGANVAVRLARRGVRVGLMAAVGTDELGAIVRRSLAAEDVHLVSPAESPSPERTGVVVVLTEEDGRRSMLSQRVPFAGRLTSGGMGARWVVVSGYLLLEAEGSRLAGQLAGLTARRAIIGCDIPDGLAPRWMRGLAALEPELLVLNVREACSAMPGVVESSEAARRLAMGPEMLVVVTEAHGAVASLAGVIVTAAAPRDAHPTDTTGAGDAVAAALLAHLLRDGWPPGASELKRALAAAVATGSAVAAISGAQGRVAGEPSGRHGR